MLSEYYVYIYDLPIHSSSFKRPAAHFFVQLKIDCPCFATVAMSAAGSFALHRAICVLRSSTPKRSDRSPEPVMFPCKPVPCIMSPALAYDNDATKPRPTRLHHTCVSSKKTCMSEPVTFPCKLVLRIISIALV